MKLSPDYHTKEIVDSMSIPEKQALIWQRISTFLLASNVILSEDEFLRIMGHDKYTKLALDATAIASDRHVEDTIDAIDKFILSQIEQIESLG